MADNISVGPFAITAGVALTQRAYGLYVVGAGNITGKDGLGVTFTDYPVAANSYHPFEVTEISAATATGIWGLKRPQQ